MKTAGRPKGLNNKVLMAFRFPRETARSIKRIAARHELTQARVLEILVTRYGKELVLSRGAATAVPATIPNCRAPNPESIRGGAEQNPQVPLASEDAFAQVPGNAETAVG